MGLDVLDLVFRLEGRFGIEISRGDWLELMRRNEPPDVAVGDLFDLVCRRAIQGGVQEADSLWPIFQRDVSEALGVEPEEVAKWKWILRDLGAT